MSHFTKCELKMTNLAAIRAALEDLKLNYEEAAQGQQVVVRGYRGDTLKAAFKIDMGRYDIGVIANENGTYDITADWWGVETTRASPRKSSRTSSRSATSTTTSSRPAGLRARGGGRGERRDTPRDAKVER